MKPRALLPALLVVLGAAVCVRLGFWQIARLHGKQRLNAALRAELAGPPLALGDVAPPYAVIAGHRVRVAGVFDPTRFVLLSGRAREGAPGVDVAAPLLLPGGGAVLVDRGWVPSPDAMTAHPEDLPPAGAVRLTALPEPLPLGAGGRPWLRVPSARATLWSVRTPDADSLAARLPYPVAPYLLRALPDSGAPAARGAPQPAAPRPADEFMHVSYAIQWFLFATILVVGSLLFARRGRGPAAGGPDAIPERPGHGGAA